MTTLSQTPLSLHSPHAFHSHSSETTNQQDMEQADGEPADGSSNGNQTQYPHAQTHTLIDPTPHHLIQSHSTHLPPDFDMEDGEDTAGVSPQSPWNSLQHRSTTPQGPPVETISTTAPAVIVASAALPSPSATHGGTTLVVAPVEPSPDLDMADNPSMSLQRSDMLPPSPLSGRPQVNDHGLEDEDDSGEEDEDEEESDGHNMRYYPFEEDLSVPSSEEVRIINNSVEHSALDNAHWQARTFFDIKDPEVLPIESGIIEWTIDGFNGTKENPRKELLIRSHTVRVGDHDWRIKVLPRGHLSTDRVSVYVECVSLQDQPQSEWAEEQLPLPTIKGTKLPKRRAVAAQISVLMYNPSEPRVYEFRPDAHQFHSDSPDHGWSRFTAVPWHEMHRRSYIARQPLLRNDKVAFKAFIRVVYDPTGCLWAHTDSGKAQDSVVTTGLQQMPAFDELAIGPVIALWLHLRPFRYVLYKLSGHATSAPETANSIEMLQAILYRMRSRTVEPESSSCRSYTNEYMDCIFDADRDSHDIMQTMDELLYDMEEQLKALLVANTPVAPAARCALSELDLVFGSRKDHFSGPRKTKLSIIGKPSIQEVVNGAKEGLGALGSPQLLTIELERQVFDREKRCWKKLLDKVHLDDEISVDGTMYTLYGFAAHGGHLQNGKYSSYFRPNGLGNLWYSYATSPHERNGQPECLTLAKAVSPREGSTVPKSIEEPVALHDRSSGYGGFGHPFGDAESVAYVVLYVRSDVASEVFYMYDAEDWNVPRWILNDYKVTVPTAESTDMMENTDRFNTASISGDNPGNGLQHNGSDAIRPAVGGAQDGDADMHDVARSIPATSGSVKDTTGDDWRKCVGSMTKLNYLSQPFYHGMMKYGEYEGEGHLIYLNGNDYKGGFEDGKRTGFGLMTYQNGDVYKGTWRDEKHDGVGTYTEKRSGNVYKGSFKEGKKYGQGTTTWKMSEEQTRLCQICYCEEANTAFYDCGHVVSCGGCARGLEHCPVCRRRVRDVLRLFYTA